MIKNFSLKNFKIWKDTGDIRFHNVVIVTLNKFGSVLPEFKKEFKRTYEPRNPLSVEEQSRILREQINLIPHLNDPWRSREMLELGLMDENGFVPMGKPKALQILKARDKFKQSKMGRVIDFFTGLIGG